MPLKLDFPRCKDSYVPHNFFKQNEGRYNFGRMVDVIAHCKEKVVLITAPPGIGKSRASEEIHTQLVLRMSGHSVLYVKLSRVISFWTDEKNTPTVKGLLLECLDESKFLEFQQRLDDGKMIAVLDGFDEICPDFRTKVITLIKELLVKGTKVLITSRPQEKDKIIKGLEQEADITLFKIENFVDYQKVLMLQTRLNIDENR
jgi:predicted NACHT family NTPase